VNWSNKFHLSRARDSDIAAVKEIVDAYRSVFGFVPKSAFSEAAGMNWLLVAKIDGALVGFVRFRHRHDKTTILYEIGVSNQVVRQGIGRALISRLVDDAYRQNQLDIRLKCPIELPANHFYLALGFKLIGMEKGKKRDLNIWRLEL
jgi:N-acetylglutamate synthase-like GNAT family acetyltransferase